MAGFMSRCPFWSTTKEKVECYSECPIKSESLKGQDDKLCIFNECSEAGSIDFKEIMKEDYGFLNLSIYDDEKRININY
ncbi:hypothetical protein [Clostridium beijerinckii]|nr:hypothetical protein [Clostridium beijerinckii]